MVVFINIKDRERLYTLLATLQPGTLPLWGIMSAQNMVEHLANEVQYANGKKTTSLSVTEEEAGKKKKAAVLSDWEMTRGIQVEQDADAEPIQTFPNLQTAIAALKEELDTFDIFFEKKGRTAMHPGFGAMNYEEWLTWHGKHFTHHFRQFGLI